MNKLKQYKSKYQFYKAKSYILEILKTAHNLEDTIYLKQQLTLCYYKDNEINYKIGFKKVLSILFECEELLENNKLENFDKLMSENLSLIGAVYKRYFEKEKKLQYLKKAIDFYEKAYTKFKKVDNGYAGINYANLYEILWYELDKIDIENSCLEKTNEIRKELKDSIQLNHYLDYFSLANIYLGLNDTKKCNEILKDGIDKCKIAEWEKYTTFVDLKEYLNSTISFSVDGDEKNVVYRNLYYHIDSFLLPKDKISILTNFLDNYNFYGQHKLPQSSELYQIFLREYPNSEVFEYFNNYYYSQVNWTDNYNDIKLPCKLLLTTTSYIKEIESFDYSVDNPISIVLPHKWIIDKMKLKHGGIDGEWIDENGDTASLNPTIKYGNKFFEEYKSLLIKKDKFLKFLSERELTIIWIVWGEKQIRDKELFSKKTNNYGIGEICGYGYFDKDNFIEKKWICND